jgi:hypothetical protein
MQKNDIGKTAGLCGAVSLIVVLICEMVHNGGIP